jgi:phosphoglycerol transferase MdoB-like AlkP superfamily enzyme
LEISRVDTHLKQVRTGGIFLYSLLVIATALPGVESISSLLVVSYYIIVPGYCITLLFSQERTTAYYLFSSFAWSMAILASIVAIRDIFQPYDSIPINIVVPLLTVVLLSYDHLRGR